VDDHGFRAARRIIEILRAAGHQAWIIGGAVRDLLIGTMPPDWDVATSAHPADVQALFHRTIPVGVQFGVVRVRLMGAEVEVATFRADLGYSDGRRPDAVRFTDLREDVLRRDFTINGLALDPGNGEVVDLVEGIADLRAGRIRAIGNADARFAEDLLRPLRAVRLAARTGFSIESGTWEAVRRAAGSVAVVSVERIAEELKKTLLSSRPGLGWSLLADSGILEAVLPEVAGGPSVAQVSSALDASVGSDAETMWANVLWPIGPAGSAGTLRRLKYSNHFIRDTSETIRLGQAASRFPIEDRAAAKKLLREARAAAGLAVLAVCRQVEGLDDRPVREAREFLLGLGPEDLWPLRLLTGDDVLAAGIPRGKGVSEALCALEDAQLRGEVTTTEAAKAFVCRWSAKMPESG
jgi:tRNA nucleotidyltransferase/poly(A) polymerase